MNWGWTQEIERVRARLERKITDAVTGILLATLSSSSSPLGDSDAVQSFDDGKDPESDTKAQRPVVRILPFGFASRQPAGLRGITLRFGSSNALFIGIIPTQKYGPQSLAVGEAALYCKVAGTTVYLDANGNVNIQAGAGADVVVNGGTAKVARVGDATAGHTHSAGALMCPNTGTGSPVAITGSTASATDTVNQGAAHFKA